MIERRAPDEQLTPDDIAWLDRHLLAAAGLAYLDDVIDKVLAYREAVRQHLAESALRYADEFFDRLALIRSRTEPVLARQKAVPIPPDTKPSGFCRKAPLLAVFFVDSGGTVVADFLLRELLVLAITLSGRESLRKIGERNFVGFRTLVEPANRWALDAEIDEESVTRSRFNLLRAFELARIQLPRERSDDVAEMSRRRHILSGCTNLRKIILENMNVEPPRTLDRSGGTGTPAFMQLAQNAIQGMSWHADSELRTQVVALPNGRKALLLESWAARVSRHDLERMAAEPPVRLEACRAALQVTDETGHASAFFSIEARNRAGAYFREHLARRNQVNLSAPGALVPERASALLDHLLYRTGAVDDLNQGHAIFRLLMRLMMGANWAVLEEMNFGERQSSTDRWVIVRDGRSVRIPIRRPAGAYARREKAGEPRLPLTNHDTIELPLPHPIQRAWQQLSRRFGAEWSRLRKQTTRVHWRRAAIALLDAFGETNEVSITLDGVASPFLGALIQSLNGVEWVIPWMTGDERYRTTPQEYYGTLPVAAIVRCHAQAVRRLFGPAALPMSDQSAGASQPLYVGSLVPLRDAAFAPMIRFNRDSGKLHQALLPEARRANEGAARCMLMLLAHTNARRVLRQILKPYFLPGPSLFVDDKIVSTSGNLGPHPLHPRVREAFEDYLDVMADVATWPALDRASRARIGRAVRFYRQLWSGLRGTTRRDPKRNRDAWPYLFQVIVAGVEGDKPGQYKAVPVTSAAEFQQLCDLVLGDGAVRLWEPNQLRAQLFSAHGIGICDQADLNQMMRHAPCGRGTFEPVCGRPPVPGIYVGSASHAHLLSRFASGRGAVGVVS